MKLVVVSQNGCNPCIMVKNYLDDADVEYKIFNLSDEEFVEVEGENLTSDDLAIMATPITILFDGADEVSRVRGFDPEQLEVLISQL